MEPGLLLAAVKGGSVELAAEVLALGPEEKGAGEASAREWVQGNPEVQNRAELLKLLS